MNALIKKLKGKPGIFKRNSSPNAKGKKRLWIVIVLALVGVGIGGSLYLRERQKKMGLEYAVERLNADIAAGDLAALSLRVDFDGVTGSLADAWNQAQSAAPLEGMQRRKLQDRMQLALYKAFTTPRRVEQKAEEKTEGDRPGTEKKAKPEKKGFQTIPPLPPVLPENFVEQLAAEPFRVLGRDGELGLVVTQIRHPDLSLQLPLQLTALQTEAGWRFTRLANAEKLAQAWKEAEENFRVHREALFFTRNAEIREIMNRHCFIIGCQAGVAKVGKDGSVLITLNLEGVNTGSEVLRSAALRCLLQDQRGNTVDDTSLSFARWIGPETAFRQYWNFEYDPGTWRAMALSKGDVLTCTTEVEAVSLENGMIIYPHPYSELTDEKPDCVTEKPK